MVVAHGALALALALTVALAAAVLAALALATRRAPFLEAARRALLSVSLLACFAAGALVMAFLEPADVPMRLDYVAKHSSRDMPAFYKVAALWGGMSGSLLFWCALLSVASACAFLRPSSSARIGPDAGAILALALVQCFFLGVLQWAKGCQPFAPAPFVVAEGRGLNPLLQHPAMAIHPPMLYAGFVSITVPFAFAIGALLSGELGREWIARSRRWTIMGWTILSAGIVLGGYWAYVELGWGGVWAWDPVENASFLPWLVMTAFLHSVMVQEHRGMLKVWNVALVVIAFWTTIFGTFLTRSGVLASVHTFAENKDVYVAFLAFLGAIAIGGGGLVVWRARRGDLASERRLEGFLSREFAFVANNVLFLSLALTILVGTVYPTFSEKVLGTPQSIGPPWFNLLTIPQFALLILLMGAGPLVPWRKASVAALRASLAVPAYVGLTVGVVSGVWIARTYGVELGWKAASAATVVLGAIAFAFATLVQEVVKGTRARRHVGGSFLGAAVALAFSNRRRYGGYVVHLAVLLVAVGFTAHTAFKITDERTLAVGEVMRVGGRAVVGADGAPVVGADGKPSFEGGYELEFLGTSSVDRPEWNGTLARLAVRHEGQPVATLVTENRYYPASQQSTSEVALHKTLWHDLYVVAVAHPEDGRRATFLIHVNPLIDLVFAGTALLVLGALFAAWPGGPRARRVGAVTVAPGDLSLAPASDALAGVPGTLAVAGAGR